VPGGSRRQESVAAGLAAATAEVVLVHDAARPLAGPDLADRVAAAARQHGAAVPVRPVRDSAKRVAEGWIDASVDRAGLAVAQTPQGARRELLAEAFAAWPARGEREFGDEAALLVAAGIRVAAVDGEAANLKVTVPEDLVLADAWLTARLGPIRTCHGRDVHPFGPGEGLALGGIVIPEAPRLHGHSDGDVALHAIADALLGGAGLGDLGERFPARDPASAGIDSGILLEVAVAEAAAAGWRPERVEVRIEAGRPWLGRARLEAMRGAIAAHLALPLESVDVRASSANLTGPTGSGLAIAADALLALRRNRLP
jgi:2-C-methyl-D-erythritol 2,4-cyclodiphosphate synthase